MGQNALLFSHFLQNLTIYIYIYIHIYVSNLAICDQLDWTTWKQGRGTFTLMLIFQLLFKFKISGNEYPWVLILPLLVLLVLAYIQLMLYFVLTPTKQYRRGDFYLSSSCILRVFLWSLMGHWGLLSSSNSLCFGFVCHGLSSQLIYWNTYICKAALGLHHYTAPALENLVEIRLRAYRIFSVQVGLGGRTTMCSALSAWMHFHSKWSCLFYFFLHTLL